MSFFYLVSAAGDGRGRVARVYLHVVTLVVDLGGVGGLGSLRKIVENANISLPQK